MDIGNITEAVAEAQDGAEIVIGIVAPVGINLDPFIDVLVTALADVNYRAEVVRLSKVLEDCGLNFLDVQFEDGEELNWNWPAPNAPLDERIETLQTAGNNFRRLTERNDAMALIGLWDIAYKRKAYLTQAAGVVVDSNEAASKDLDLPTESAPQQTTGEDSRDLPDQSSKSSDIDPAPTPVDRGFFVQVPRTAYILRSLKHPAEVDTLRSIYGPRFFLLAAFAPREVRERALSEEITQAHHGARREEWELSAKRLILTDEAETASWGQHVRDTFPKADVFVDITKKAFESEINRFIRLVFGHPFLTPSKYELGMFLAQATALRSADLSRQVGAVIMTHDGDICSVGTNEVPKFGGGLYWEGDEADQRDFRKNRNIHLELRTSALGEILIQLLKLGALQIPEEVLDDSENQSSSDDSSEGSRQPRSTEDASPSFSGTDATGLTPKATQFMRELFQKLNPSQLMSIGEWGRTVHAEMTAILDAARRGIDVNNSTLIVTTFPCSNCTRHIVAAGIRKVVFIEPYPESRWDRLHDDSVWVYGTSYGPEAGKVVFEPFFGIAPSLYLNLFTMPRRKYKNGQPINWELIKRETSPRNSENWTELGYLLDEYSYSVIINNILMKSDWVTAAFWPPP